MNRYTIALVASCASLVATGAAAQDAIMALNPTTMIGYAGTTAGNAYARRQVGPRLVARRAAPARVNVAQVLSRTAFVPNPAVKAQVYARAVAHLQRVSPPDAAKLRAELVSGRMHKAVADYLARYGMSANNLVDTTAVYLAAAWFASRADTGDPSPAQMKGLRAQVASVYATMPQVLGADAAAKQELSEANVLQAWVSSSIANQAARDPATAGQSRAAIVQGVKATYQLDLARMNLTSQGLR